MGTSNGGRSLLGILAPFAKLAQRRSQVRTVWRATPFVRATSVTFAPSRTSHTAL
ncbi:MAG: hypothetical protein ACLPR9_04680 [Acidimicrobiales bacterium]